jgi:FkbM family methyltransferase
MQFYKLIHKLPSKWHPQFATIRVENGNEFQLPNPLQSGHGQMLLFNSKYPAENETVEVFRGLIEKSRVFFDVGAHIGTYTFLAKCYNPNVRIWAFEPEQEAYTLLKRGIFLNHWTEIVAEPLALADVEGQTTLYVKDSETSLNPHFRRGTVEQICDMLPLDLYCKDQGISSIDLMKIDTESTEPSVLRGGTQIIADCKPDIICEVLKGRTEYELMNFFSPLGYNFYHLRSEGPVKVQEILGDSTYRYLNYLFTVRNDL